MNLVSNLMLVDEIGKKLNSPENINLIGNIFEDLMKVDLP